MPRLRQAGGAAAAPDDPDAGAVRGVRQGARAASESCEPRIVAMNQVDLQKAIDEGVYEAAKDRAKMEAVNQISEGGDLAQKQFGVALAVLQDAHGRMTQEVNKLFPGKAT
jgi:hypothetical protein